MNCCNPLLRFGSILNSDVLIPHFKPIPILLPIPAFRADIDTAVTTARFEPTFLFILLLLICTIFLCDYFLVTCYFSIARFFALSLPSQFLCSCKMTIEEIQLQACDLTVVFLNNKEEKNTLGSSGLL